MKTRCRSGRKRKREHLTADSALGENDGNGGSADSSTSSMEVEETPAKDSLPEAAGELCEASPSSSAGRGSRDKGPFLCPRNVENDPFLQSKLQEAKMMFQSARSLLERKTAKEEEPSRKRGRKDSTTIPAAGEEKKGDAVVQNQPEPIDANKTAATELTDSSNVNDASEQAVLPFAKNQGKLQLSSLELPRSILNNYRANGITTLFPWQAECLAKEKVLEGRNLLYSAPTSAGKTLVSEILMTKRVIKLRRKAIVVLPFVSLAKEKVSSLQRILGNEGIRVGGFIGGVNPRGGFKEVDIAVCTIEKANSLVNKLLEENELADLGTVVVDELHMIGDSRRGYLLELLLTKILYMTSVKKFDRIQIIGMTATLPNIDVLAHWLDAELYTTEYRPVPLKQLLKIRNTLCAHANRTGKSKEPVPVRNVKLTKYPLQVTDDPDDIVYLSLETVLEGYSVLVFCPTKKKVESTAKTIAENIDRIGDPLGSESCGKLLKDCFIESEIKKVLEGLLHFSGGVKDALYEAVQFGVGFHHGGLTTEVRDLVESAFKSGTLKVMVSTSTLSAGVNLPARRVIISSPVRYGTLDLDPMEYHQMCGRAGRIGIDTQGESILICPADLKLKLKGMKLFGGEMSKVTSALMKSGGESPTSCMKRALLEAVVSGVASRLIDVASYAKCTFLFHSSDAGLSPYAKEAGIKRCLEYLEEQNLIRVQQFEEADKPEEYTPTQLGTASFGSSLSPDEGIAVFKGLSKARECFVLENELHLIYQVTPINVSDDLKSISCAKYHEIWGKLEESERKVATLVGIKEKFLLDAMMFGDSWNNPREKEKEIVAIHKRFYAALALNDLVNEKSLAVVGDKYQLEKGVLQNLQRSASTFAGMVTAFCTRLRWRNLALLMGQFQERLQFGVQLELCDLVKLETVNRQRARILYDAGLETIPQLAAADPGQVERILEKANPFRKGSTEAEAAKRIVEDARVFVQTELEFQGSVLLASQGQASQGSRQHAVINPPVAVSLQTHGPKCQQLAPMIDVQVDAILSAAVSESFPVVNGNDPEAVDEGFESRSGSQSSTVSTSIVPSVEPVSSAAFVGNMKLTTKVVTSADELPSSFFSCSEMIGMGVKLVSPDSTDDGNEDFGEDGCLHSNSVAVYNGVDDTIWILRWKNERSDGSRKKKKSTTNSRLLEGLLGKIEAGGCAMALFDCKEQVKSILTHCGSKILAKLPHGGKMWDPSVAQWMWNSDDKDVSRGALTDTYLTVEEKSLLESCSNLEKNAIEAFQVWKVMWELKEKLIVSVAGLWNHFIATEMPSVRSLILMEMNGLGLDAAKLERMEGLLRYKSALLELWAFRLAGRKFDLGSSKDIKKVLLEVVGWKPPKKVKGLGQDVLAKVDNELARVILEWKKVASVLKVMNPFQNSETGRVHGQYSHFTATGRVAMSDPNLQCIPKDMDVGPLSYDSRKISEIIDACKTKFSLDREVTALIQKLGSFKVDVDLLNNMSVISMRNAFVPACADEFTILAADYSQLELRILAHLSEDEKLLKTLNKNTDVFVKIASQLKNLRTSQVTNAMRQEAKGIVYGVIYGMAAGSLSEQMGIEKSEADNFITQFLETYPGIKAFIDNAHTRCKEKGYIETMTGRRRNLPLIHSKNSEEQAKAMRQAVNSQIQGSAADLVKAAMTRIHSFLQSEYPKSAIPIEWSRLKRKENMPKLKSSIVCFPILNLHDELVFEVRKTHLEQVARAVKQEMESCMQLKVKLPVVIKTGDSWGNLKIYEVE